MADENAKELSRREEKLFVAKRNLDMLNQEIAYNFIPERADFTVERALGVEFGIDLFDSEPVRCRRDLGNARAAMLRPAGQEWFKAKTQDSKLNEQPNIATFLDWLNERARALLYYEGTGFVRAEKEADQDLVAFGNSVKTIEAELDRNGPNRILMMRDWHLRDCAWLDDANGIRQDLMFRRFKASARHIRSKFPEADLAEPIKKALEKDGDKDQEFKLCHAMMRADEYDYYKKPKGRKAPWVSVYYDADHKMLLRERPSQRFRYIVDRWGTLSGSQYGYSPAAMTSLPDARGMQTMARVLLEAGEKSLDPPLKATQRAIKGEINAYAAGVTWVDHDYDEKLGPAIEPLLPGDIKPAIGIDLINRATMAMRDTWFLTKLTLPQQAKTAYETAQLVEEFIRANIPLFEPWQAGTAMDLEEIFGVLMEIGAFGSVASWPKELSGNSLDFAFVNPLQLAIERNKVNQATQALGIVAGAAKIDPSAAHAIDVVKIVQDATRGTGAPADWVRDEDDVAARVGQDQQVGNVLGAIQTAGQAADVVNSGLDAAGKLQELNKPAVDGSAVYGPV